MRQHFLDRFWCKVDVRGPDECWPWTAARTLAGYGGFQVGVRVRDGAHRLAWKLTHAEDIPAGLEVCHSCDNPPCCNPAHLRLGTAKDNAADRVARGRQSHVGPKGTAHADAKLTEADVVEIRRRYREGGGRRPSGGGRFQPTGRLTMRTLAVEYGVDHTQILRAIRGDQWGHVA